MMAGQGGRNLPEEPCMTRFPFTVRAFVLAALLAPGLAAAQTPAPKPADDLAIIRKRAEASPDLTQALRNVEQVFSTRQQPTTPSIRQMLGGIGRNPDSAPVNVRLYESSPLAEARAQFISRLLRADLDGDWTVTRQEVRETLSLRADQNTAEAFLLADTNDDGTVTFEELRAGADWAAQRRPNLGGMSRSPMLRLFDLDDDGFVTSEELDRADAALKAK